MYNTDSSIDNEDLPKEEINIRNFAKSMLLSRLFIGTYQEKRYVHALNDYRDLVRIDNNETELIQDIKHVKKRIEAYYNKHWIGITDTEMVGAPVGMCLWVELPEKILGKYWFKVKSIKFKRNEIIIRLRCLRAVDSPEKMILTAEEITNKEIKEKSLEILICIKENLLQFFAEILTIQNTKQALVYISALLVTLFIGSVQFLQYVSEFVLKLLREASIFMQSASPIFIALINMIGRCVSGLYYLIYLMFKGDSKPKYNPNYISRHDYIQSYPSRALTYRKSGVKITELN